MTPSRGRRIAFTAITLAGSLGLSCALAEAVARLAGFEPWEPPDVAIRFEPGGHYQEADPVLGYRHLPGRYRVTFGNGARWTVTHRPDTLRITAPPEARAAAAGRPEIWIFGGSFVHGWGLDDEDTFPWQLQKRLPLYRLLNFGVGGYGTLQSLLQFRQALERRPPPAIAVLAYAGFHDERNTRLRRWRKATFSYDKFGTTAQPYVRLNGSGQLDYRFDHGRYRYLSLLRYSALLQMLDEAWSRLEDRVYRSHRVSEILVSEFARIGREHGVVVVVAGISTESRTSAMLEYAESQGILAHDISLDIRRRGLTISWDSHPNAEATQRYARRLLRFLRQNALVPIPPKAPPADG